MKPPLILPILTSLLFLSSIPTFAQTDKPLFSTAVSSPTSSSTDKIPLDIEASSAIEVKDNLMATIVVVNDIAKFENASTPSFKSVPEVKRGDTVKVYIFTQGCQLSANNLCNGEAAYMIIQPDKKPVIFGPYEFTNPRGAVEITNVAQALDFIVPENAPLGDWVIGAQFIDKNTNTVLRPFHVFKVVK